MEPVDKGSMEVDEEGLPSITPGPRTEVETATAMPPHGATAVKLEPDEASLASSREQARSTLPVLPERYEILSLLGRGGMGVVYRARDRVSGEVVAVKVLLEGRANAAERFAREAAVLAGLDHPGIVRYGRHGVTQAGEPTWRWSGSRGRPSRIASGGAA